MHEHTQKATTPSNANSFGPRALWQGPESKANTNNHLLFLSAKQQLPPDESLIAAKQWQLLLRRELTASSPSLHFSFHSSCMLNGCLKPRSSSLHIKTNMPFLRFHLNYSNWREVSGSKWREKKKESENEEPLREHSWCQRDTHFRAPSVKSYLELFLSFSILIPSPRFYHLTSYEWQKPLELTANRLAFSCLSGKNVASGQIELWWMSS